MAERQTTLGIFHTRMKQRRERQGGTSTWLWTYWFTPLSFPSSFGVTYVLGTN